MPGLALAEDDPSAKLYPAKRNDTFGSPSPVTAEKLATTYNNYYEFDNDKSIWRAAQKLPIRPWTIKVTGMVEKPFEIGFDEPARQDAARGARLSPPLRRDLVDDRAVDAASR